MEIEVEPSLKRGFEQPLAEAIVRDAEARGMKLANADAFEAVTDMGVKGNVDGKPVAMGNAKNIGHSSIHSPDNRLSGVNLICLITKVFLEPLAAIGVRRS